MKSVSIIAALLLGFASASFAQVLVTLGSNGFTVDGVSSAPYSQTTTTLKFNSSLALGDAVVGALNTTYDWSSYITFGLEFSVSGTNPNLPISVYFYDTDYAVINIYSLSTNGVGSTPTVVPMTLVSIGSGRLNAVAGFQLAWEGGGTVNATFTNVVAVPESATWALLIGALGATPLLRRRVTRGC
ncbi:hypothetical protein DB345_17895 [Spartobacteria bacterium LR76]|nr:hypothetical protein DB345_17895 [Spartobacteria bacterium LR76]